MNLEEVFDQAANKRDIAIFCPSLTDNFNDKVHPRMAPRLGPDVMCAMGVVP
jgi:hypothetical protein